MDIRDLFQPAQGLSFKITKIMPHFDADQWSVLLIIVIFGAARLIVAAFAVRPLISQLWVIFGPLVTPELGPLILRQRTYSDVICISVWYLSGCVQRARELLDSTNRRQVLAQLHYFTQSFSGTASRSGQVIVPV
jgi:hypothetical protein